MLQIIFISLVALAVNANLDPLSATDLQVNSHAFDNATGSFVIVGFSRISRGLVRRDCVPAGYLPCQGTLECCPPGTTCCLDVELGVVTGKSTLCNDRSSSYCNEIS
jgi:hypothetical protein